MAATPAVGQGGLPEALPAEERSSTRAKGPRVAAPSQLRSWRWVRARWMKREAGRNQARASGAKTAEQAPRAAGVLAMVPGRNELQVAATPAVGRGGLPEALPAEEGNSTMAKGPQQQQQRQQQQQQQQQQGGQGAAASSKQ